MSLLSKNNTFLFSLSVLMSLHSRLSQILANRTLKHIDFHTEMNRGKASVRTHQLYVQRLWENILSNKNAIQTIEISYLCLQEGYKDGR